MSRPQNKKKKERKQNGILTILCMELSQDGPHVLTVTEARSVLH